MVIKLKVLVLATAYTDLNGRVAAHFIHSRNIEYLKAGIEADVLSFAASQDYVLEGIPVYTYSTYKNTLSDKQYDILVSHAPNLRNHYRFLLKYGEKFERLVFFFHGHEVLRTSEIYPEPYPYMKKDSPLSKWQREIYDFVKLRVLRRFFERIKHKSEFIFVSEWMAEKFYQFLMLEPMNFEGKQHIIYNCIGRTFEEKDYNRDAPKMYDFITIRNMLDKSKYAIDVVCRIAESNPEFKFCVIGKGDFFRHNKKPDNLEWIDKNLSHEEIVSYLNGSYCALLPTRADAQGVMACETATFGIPLITSNIDVCKEIFRGFNNVAFIDNDADDIDIGQVYNQIVANETHEKNERYFLKNTVGKEISLFRGLEKQ